MTRAVPPCSCLRAHKDLAVFVEAGIQALRPIHRRLAETPEVYECSLDLDEARLDLDDAQTRGAERDPVGLRPRNQKAVCSHGDPPGEGVGGKRHDPEEAVGRIATSVGNSGGSLELDRSTPLTNPLHTAQSGGTPAGTERHPVSHSPFEPASLMGRTHTRGALRRVLSSP
jgi:hypothetical protein